MFQIRNREQFEGIGRNKQPVWNEMNGVILFKALFWGLILHNERIWKRLFDIKWGP